MKLSKLVGGLVVAYLLIAVVISIVQGRAGADCNSLVGERQASSRGSLVMTIILWPADLASHAADGSLGEYFIPTGCVGG